ncbi:hypothetical protein GCM10022276_26600 [Sphingomonas limnosediminicola]|uniref:EthD domain-containing protein n=1 Tax=Sphingomonas limnosediminicola TaxID=940133 RepID=A0ABP7LQS6_9SPHN
MITVTITYPNVEGATFDWGYYQRVHLPMVGQKLSPFGLTMASVFRGVDTAGGGKPQFIAMCLLTFADEQSGRNAMESEGAGELGKDVAKFTNIQPVVQFNKPID